MTALKEKINNSSLFRIIYIVDLFFCNISFLQIPAYILLPFLFIWGVYLVFHNQKKNNTFFRLRFGLWIGAFLACTLISILINFSLMVFYSLLMFLHILVCFFVFYGMHTEPDFNFRNELYKIAKIMVYLTTIANVIGIFCLMFDITFEWYWVKFTIYENRFTGVYYNPNLLGFASVISIVCCHILHKEKIISEERPAISKTWFYSCIATNIFSLILCDSNASFVLALGYAIVYFAYMFFADKSDISTSKIILKIISLVLVGTFLVSSALMLRTICQTGFAVLLAKKSSVVDILLNNEEIKNDIINNPIIEDSEDSSVTFSHENSNIDSGRFKLWEESLGLFKISPVIGISHGNIVFYSEEYLNGTLSYTYNNSDLHNGFLTILVSTGIIGFALFCIFGFRFAKHSAQHLFLQKKTFRNDVYPSLFAFLFAYLFYALFERALLYDISFMVMWFWLMMGYMSCYIAKFEPMLETQYLFHKKRLTRTLL